MVHYNLINHFPYYAGIMFEAFGGLSCFELCIISLAPVVFPLIRPIHMYIGLHVIFCTGLYTYHSECSLGKHRVVLCALFSISAGEELCAL